MPLMTANNCTGLTRETGNSTQVNGVLRLLRYMESVKGGEIRGSRGSEAPQYFCGIRWV